MQSTLRKRFGQRVKELRLASGQSQEAFADKCGFARSYMSRIERGIANPSLDAVQIVADGLGVEVAELFCDMSKVSIDESVILVPYARDGSCFNQSTFRPGTREYIVGEKGKGNTKRFKSFDKALDHLKRMNPAKWWRPNASGDWGVVTAVKWGPLPE